jgi:hypothetical protein
MTKNFCVAVALLAAVGYVGTVTGTAAQQAAAASIEELWQDRDISSLDLRWGGGGKEGAPSPDIEYEFKGVDDSGNSAGYDVAGPDGKNWRVKIGVEAQPEMVASRVLWAVGYHQPTMYFMPRWKLQGGPVSTPPSGRFRLSSDHTSEANWSWAENPFVGTRELRGLLVVNLILNNWDTKSTQNRIYTREGQPGRWFVVQDLGAALGKKTRFSHGTRGNIADFESQKLILGIENGRIKFDYHGLHRGLYADITPADVVWACERLGRISDAQWVDAFASGAYSPIVADRFIKKIKSKIQEGLALGPRATSNQ